MGNTLKRDYRIDIMKGIAIILMVLGHSGFQEKKFIYLFHMAVFFMVSGYLYKPNNDGGIKGIVKYVIKKIKGIWLPYFVWNLIYTLLNNVFILLNIYSDTAFEVAGTSIVQHTYMSIGDMAKNIIKGVAMVGRTELGGAFWFLRTLFAVTIVFCVIDYVVNKVLKNKLLANIVHFIVASLFLSIGFVAHIKGITNLSVPVVFSSYILYYIGYVVKQCQVMTRISKIVGFVISVIVLVLSDMYGPSISIGDNNFGNPVYMLMCSIAGWTFLYVLSDMLSKTKISKFVEFIGQNTLTIVIHHFWCMKLVHVIQILTYDYPIRSLAAFPILNSSGIWWVAYLVAGVCIPIILQLIWTKIKYTFSELFQKGKKT